MSTDAETLANALELAAALERLAAQRRFEQARARGVLVLKLPVKFLNN